MMVAGSPESSFHEEVSPDERVDSSCATKNKRRRIPKRMLKSEREKLKREHFNELFCNLASVLELTDPNSGKACIIGEAIRFVNDMASQIKCLREENAALLSESNYVTIEKNELKDENSSLESQILKVKRKIDERAQLKPALNVNPPEPWRPAEPVTSLVQDPPSALPPIDLSMQQQPILGPLFVIPIGQSLPDNSTLPKVPSHVMKPHARYPSPGDSWPLQLLQDQAETEAAT